MGRRTIPVRPAIFVIAVLLGANISNGEAVTPVYSVAFTNSNSSLISSETIFGVNSEMEFTNVNLPPCNTKITTDCISKFEYQIADGAWKKAAFLRNLPVRTKWSGNGGSFYFDEGKVIPENSKMNIPASSSGTVWELPGANHAEGDQYLLNFHIFGNLVNCSQSGSGADLKITCTNDSTTDFKSGRSNLTIIPLGNLRTGDASSMPKDFSSSFEVYDGNTCTTFPDQGWFCATRAAFPANLNFRVSAILEKTKPILNGQNWLIGRVANPKIVITPSQNNATTVIFEAKPVSLYNASGTLPSGDEGLKAMFDAENNVWMELYNEPMSPGYDAYRNKFLANPGNFTVGGGGADSASWVRWNGLAKYIDERSSRDFSIWKFHTVTPSGESYAWLSRCTGKTGISGLSASNATVMFPAPPTWNQNDQSLNLRIAAPHLDAEGKVISGFYGVVMPVETASCLWGKDNTKAKVEISVIDKDGVRDIQTSSLKTRSGFVYFDASNFHYSAPELKIRVIGVSKSVKARVPAKKIKCVKGKLVKYVTVIPAKCPTGYKKVN